MRFSLPSFALVAATFVLSKSINPERASAKIIDWAALDAATNAAPDARAVTNAQRLARGLPLLKPKAHRRHGQRGAPHRLGSRVQSAPRAETSPLPPTSRKCNIRADSGNGNGTFGYISPKWNESGEYGIFQSDQAGALEVSFSYTADTASQLDMTATNSPSTTYPFFGAAVGFASTDNNFGSGSYNYAPLAGTTQSPAGSPPSDTGDSSYSAVTGVPGDTESAIWTYDPSTQAVTAQWINTDGSAPATHIVYANDDNQALLITGDVKTLQDTFGVPYPEVTFTCVPPMQFVPPARI